MGHNRAHSALPSQTHSVCPIGSAWKGQLCKWSRARQTLPSPYLSLSFLLPQDRFQPLPQTFLTGGWRVGVLWAQKLNNWAKCPFAGCASVALDKWKRKQLPHLHTIDSFIKMSLVNRKKWALLVRPHLSKACFVLFWVLIASSNPNVRILEKGGKFYVRTNGWF